MDLIHFKCNCPAPDVFRNEALPHHTIKQAVHPLARAVIEPPNGRAHQPPRRAAQDDFKKDTVLSVKSAFASLYPYASSDLIRPAHNKPYQRCRFRQPISAVPRGCGQLASGVGWASGLKIASSTFAASLSGSVVCRGPCTLPDRQRPFRRARQDTAGRWE